jgi:hypothetical protein
MNVHNFETGRYVIEKHMIKQCKCHGVSGSCELKTCWKAMPLFSVIAKKLKQKYDEAIQVEVKKTINDKHKIVSKNQNDYDDDEENLDDLTEENKEQITKSQLIFLNKSPDFCRPNARLAAYGTKGRVCSKDSRGIDGCKLLCCGRSHKTKLETFTYKCNCTFSWCCSVTCKECKKSSYVSYCK